METVSSVTDQCVISLSLLANIDPDAIRHYTSQSANWMGRSSWGTIRAVCIPSTASSSSMGPNWLIQLGSTQPSVIRQGTAQDLHNGAQDHLSTPAPECLQIDSAQPVFRATHPRKRAHSPSPSSSKRSRDYEPEQSDESSTCWMNPLNQTPSMHPSKRPPRRSEST